MRKAFIKLFWKAVGRISALTAVLIMIPSLNVHAAQDYTVTFRPGNVGRFGIAGSEDEASVSRKTVQEMAQEVADILYGENAVVTENGAIKVKVAAGSNMPAAPAYILPEEGYCVRPWGPDQGETVTKNVDYVVDYGRLTDGVEYTVTYVDDQSGEAVAPPAAGYANIGDTVAANAPATVTNSGAGIYYLTGVQSQEIILSGDADANVIVFTYTYRYDPGTTTTEIVRNVAGDTVVITENAAAADNGNAVPGAQALGGLGAGQGGGPNVAAPNVPGEGQELVDIQEEETPLAANPGDGNLENPTEEMVDIGEEEVPLGTLETSGGLNIVVIWAGVFGAAAVVLAVVWIQTRKKRANQEEEQ